MVIACCLAQLLEKFEDESIPHLEITAPSPAWDPYDEDLATQEDSHLNIRGHLISVPRSDGPSWNAEIGIRSANAFCEVELHWKLSQVSLILLV